MSTATGTCWPTPHRSSNKIFGAHDFVARNERLADVVPNVTEIEFDCGHWIMDEMPDETNRAILTWLERQSVDSVAV